MKRWLRESALVRVAAGFVLAAAILAWAGWMVSGPGCAGWLDGAVRWGVREMRSPMWTSLLLTMTKLGSTLYLWIAGAAAGLVFIYMRLWRPLVLFITVMAGQAALHYGFKWLVARPRPAAMISYQAVESFSFPSGHAVAGLCLFASIAWIAGNRVESAAAKFGVWVVAVVLIFLIGLSRAYIGIHYPSDVIAGWLAAAVWTATVMSNDRTDV